MSEHRVGDICEINYPNEGVDYWRRVRIVNINDDGKTAWVRMADIIGNSFPVSRTDLRPVSATSNERVEP